MDATDEPSWMTEDVRQYRDAARRFAKEVLEPNDVLWRQQQQASREAWMLAGTLGLILPDLPEAYGGADGSAAHAAVAFTELAYSGNSALGLGMNHIVGHYFLRYGTEAQKQAWLPGLADGSIVAAIAMTEPGTGSDLQAVRTRAELRDGRYVINGSKIFISNGQMFDMVVVVAKTDPSQRAKGISLLIVDAKTPGLRRGNALDKLGLEGQDTSELFFDDCTVGADCILGGEPSRGFYQLVEQLPFERVQIALQALGTMRRAYDLTLAYVRQRQAFGKALIEFQNTRFVLADVKATLAASGAYADRIVQKWLDGTLDPASASMAKFWITERQAEVIDRCLQMFGGYGYMKESLIARLYADARLMRIVGGTNEIQRELVGKSL